MSTQPVSTHEYFRGVHAPTLCAGAQVAEAPQEFASMGLEVKLDKETSKPRLCEKPKE